MRSKGQIEPGRACLGWIGSRDGETQLDLGYLTWHAEGHSFTGEEVVEMSCHSSPVIVRSILDELMAAGAQPAAPGEFTYRAVLHGRIDLAQAEGIRDLIEAQTAAAACAALGQMRGDLSKRTGSMRAELIEIISALEASLEFAEEPDVQDQRAPASEPTPLKRQLGGLLDQTRRFVASYRQGRVLRDGATVVLAGRPNSGKSSLFNRLLSQDRAIVSAEAGTTRDFISERIDLQGIPVTLVDTAGLRADARGVEAEGIDRARLLMATADLILVLCGSDESPDAADATLLGDHAGRALLVASKTDLRAREAATWSDGAVRVSGVTGEGIESLKSEIARRVLDAEELPQREILITEARHHVALQGCVRGLSGALEAMQSGASEEIVLVDLYTALNHLGEISGASALEEVYDRIFSTFCIGK